LPATCAKAGVFTDECNPVTNEPCDTAGGEDCDWNGSSGWQCYADGNTLDEGAACGSDTAFCKPGLNCVITDEDAGTGTCGKSCCANSDCTAPKTCVAWDTTTIGSSGDCK